MTHTYSIKGMTCYGCESTIKSKILTLPEVLSVDVSKETNTATIEMQKHISLRTFQKALGGDIAKFTIAAQHNERAEQAKGWMETYKPILVIFGYILFFTIAFEWRNENFLWTRWMNNFMAGFFITFSFFKMLNLKGFSETYAMYDVVARRWNGWGYVYAFVELGLGVAFFTGVFPVLTNLIALVVMSVSIIGVLKTVLNKQKIQCACLGEVFKLPMSTVTVIEDGLTILMSAIMLVQML